MLMTVLWFLLALGILVTIHEFGHFYVARRCGVKVIRFSVGFGKPLLRWRDRLGTEYTLAAIPLGGYVKMLDEREGEVDSSEHALTFNHKTVWQRMAIVSAGPVANFILAIILYFILALMGGTGVAPVLGLIPEDGVAAQSGARSGDEIFAVDGKSVATWGEVFSSLVSRVGDTGNIELKLKAFNEGRDVGVIDSTSNTVNAVSLPITRWLFDNDQPDFFDALGIVQYIPDGVPIINRVLADSAADKAGLQVGDRILAADNLPISGWQQWVSYVRVRPDIQIALDVEREGQLITLDITPALTDSNGEKVGLVGVSSSLTWPDSMIRPIEYTFSGAVLKGFSQTWERSAFILQFIKKLIFAEVSTKNLSGTLTIAQAAGDSAKAGVKSYLAFLAFLSVSLGVFNLLPIPVLDGGHLLYYVIEVLKGSPVSEKIQLVGYQVGFVMVISIMVLAHINDFVRLFS